MQEKSQPSEQAHLPKGYRFVDKSDLVPSEIIDLRTSVGWDGDNAETWQDCINSQNGIIVSVRDDQGTLVGMGRVTSDPRHAVMCDLVVNPNHQNKGIGKALVLERMRIIRELDIPYLYTDLAEDNPLKPVYEELGFKATGRGMFNNRKDA